MPLNRCPMILENTEGYSDYNIRDDWYDHRTPGLSIVLRCYGEERWIGPCLQSVLPLFDEVLITLTDKEGDRTEQIATSFHSPKIRLLKYPFKINTITTKTYGTKHQNILHTKYPGAPSVHSFSYYTNWGMAQTHHTHVSPKWDADMLLLPHYATTDFKHLILTKSMVYVLGYNVATPDLRYLSKLWPLIGPEQRFFKVDKYRYHIGEVDELTYQGIVKIGYPARWQQFPIQQTQCLFNALLRRDIYYPTPIFIHTKLLKNTHDDGRFVGKRLYDTQYPGWWQTLQDQTHLGSPTPTTIPPFFLKTPENYLTTPQ